MTIVTVLFGLLVAAHIAVGFVGFSAFRAPLSARKGGRLHVRGGRVRTRCADAVGRPVRHAEPATGPGKPWRLVGTVAGRQLDLSVAAPPEPD